MKTQPRWSTEDVIVPVSVLVPDGANVDVTADVVEFQFIFGGMPLRTQPTSAGWLTGRWIRDLGGTLAAITVGPNGGAVTLTPGRWAVCVRIQDQAEVGAAVDVLVIT